MFGGIRVAQLFLVFCVVLFVLFVFVLCLVYPILPVSLDCPFLITPWVFSNAYLIREHILLLENVFLNTAATVAKNSRKKF